MKKEIKQRPAAVTASWMEVDVGQISAEERRLATLSPSDRILHNRLAMDEEEARGMVDHLHRQIRVTHVGQIVPWDLIEQFAEWKAKLALVKDKRERMGL